MESTQIQNMVLNGRNPLFLAMLKPGVRRGFLGFSYGLDSGSFSINGSRSQDNIITFDGAVNMRTRANGTSVGTADLETVQEMQVLTANYSAEYGRSAGGQIRFVTKSGGPDFHGSAYENRPTSARTRSRSMSYPRRTIPSGSASRTTAFLKPRLSEGVPTGQPGPLTAPTGPIH